MELPNFPAQQSPTSQSIEPFRSTSRRRLQCNTRFIEKSIV